MKKIALGILLALSSLAMAAADRITELLTTLKSDNPEYVFVVAHRGDWRNAPENSVAAISSAAAMGVDMVEIDIHKTKDGNFVLMHDGNIDRMTGGTGNICDYTLDELKQYRLRNIDGTFSDEVIPTLEEALLACKGKVLVNIDKGQEYLAEIEPIIKATGTENHVVLKGRNSVVDVKSKLSGYNDIIFMPIVDLDTENAIPYIESFMADYQPSAMEFIFSAEDFEQLEYLPIVAQSGCRVWINTLWASLCGGHEDEKAMSDPDNNWGWVLDNHATIIQTDRPKELIAYLAKRGLRKMSK